MKILMKLVVAASVMPVFGSLQVNAWHCYNPHHNHCVHYNHNCHNHGWASRPSVNFGFSINTPVYRPVYEPVRVVERTYVKPVARPVTKVTKTYTAPVATTTYTSYGYPYGVCETVYSSPAVYETVSITPVVPAVYETVEYRSYQHPVSAAFNFAGALVDAFAN